MQIQREFHFILFLDMGRFKQTARKCTPPLIPVLTPTVYLNPDGTVRKDQKQKREDRIKKIQSEMAKAIEIMIEVKEMILDLDSNSDVEEILQPKV